MVSCSALVVWLAAAAPAASVLPSLATVEIRVTDRAGLPLGAAHVSIDGVSEREGNTTSSGRVTFRNIRPGKYLLHVERDAFIDFEKEFVVARGESASVRAALSSERMLVRRAPSAIRSSRDTTDLSASRVRVLSIPDLAEHELIRREPVKESMIGCSGASQARLIQLRDPLTTHAHAGADEMLYVVAGEGILKVGAEEQKISPGWFSIIPRGTSHSLTRKGRSPIILLSMLGGQPCTTAAVARR